VYVGSRASEGKCGCWHLLIDRTDLYSVSMSEGLPMPMFDTFCTLQISFHGFISPVYFPSSPWENISRPLVRSNGINTVVSYLFLVILGAYPTLPSKVFAIQCIHMNYPLSSSFCKLPADTPSACSIKCPDLDQSSRCHFQT
jgi:hypothetical protein